MAVKTFTTGEVLTAADTNTYLNNGGLVYIGAVTATSGTTIQVSNVFDSTYDAYRVTASNFRTGAAAALTLKLRNSGGASSTGYYYNSAFLNSYGGTTISWVSNANQAAYETNNVADATAIGFAIDIFNPNLAQLTTFANSAVDIRTTGNPRFPVSGFHNVATAYTGFDIISTQTISNAVIRVYGYRQA